MAPQPPKHKTAEGHIKPRSALILLLALLAGTIISSLLWFSGEHPASALALALPTIGGAFLVFDKLIE